jgi:Tfp pilus assembly protein PilX
VFYHKLKTESGFALLITLMVVSVVVSVTLAIVELSIKQLELSVDSTDSELAFQAANAGLECARFTRKDKSSDFESGAPIDFSCFEESENDVLSDVPSLLPRVNITAHGDVYWYETELSWGGNRCSQMRIVSMVTDSDAPPAGITIGSAGSPLSNYLPGYPEDTKTCGPGGRCTVVSVTGHSSDCDPANLTKVSTRSREILLEF